MIEALIAGQTDPEALAALADGRIGHAAELSALRGRVTAHHRFMLRLHLDHLDAVDAAISASIRSRGQPRTFRVACEMLTTMPASARLRLK